MCSGLLATCSGRSGPVCGSDQLQSQRAAEQECLCWSQRVCLLVPDAGETLHRHRGNMERGLRQQRLHRRTHLWVKVQRNDIMCLMSCTLIDEFFCSSRSCGQFVARHRRNRWSDSHLDPRPWRCGPLWGEPNIKATCSFTFLTTAFTRRFSTVWWKGVWSCPQVTLLFNDTRIFPPVTLGSEMRHHQLTSLTPGRLYKIVVSTFSGPNQRPQFIEGRTGRTDFEISQLHICVVRVSGVQLWLIHPLSPCFLSPVPSAVGNLHLAPQPGLMDSTSGLLATWTHGDGDLDLYAISLSTTVSPTAHTSISLEDKECLT